MCNGSFSFSLAKLHPVSLLAYTARLFGFLSRKSFPWFALFSRRVQSVWLPCKDYQRNSPSRTRKQVPTHEAIDVAQRITILYGISFFVRWAYLNLCRNGSRIACSKPSSDISDMCLCNVGIARLRIQMKRNLPDRTLNVFTAVLSVIDNK